MSAFSKWPEWMPARDDARKYLSDNGPGMAASGAAHALALCLVLFFFNTAIPPSRSSLRAVLVDIVRLGDETASPPARATRWWRCTW